jgi:hypothetical protein
MPLPTQVVRECKWWASMKGNFANSSSYKVCYTRMHCWDYVEEWNRHVLTPSPPVCTKMDGSIMLRSSLACIWTCSKYWETIHCNVHLCRSLPFSQKNLCDMHQCTCKPSCQLKVWNLRNLKESGPHNYTNPGAKWWSRGIKWGFRWTKLLW